MHSQIARSTILSCHALQWTHCICAVLLGSLRLPSATPWTWTVGRSEDWL